MKLFKMALALGAALLSGAAAPNWLTTVDTRGGGHAIGNPDAKVKLVEFSSYTCPHCGAFAREASNALDVYVASGKLQVDRRHVVRNAVDLTAAMLADCGAAAKFPRNHAALILAQPKWLPTMERATAGQKARWSTGTGAARRRAIAADLGFYPIMIGRGYDRPTIDRCLSDEAKAARLADQTVADREKWKHAGTPSFAINGALLAGTHSWDMLQLQLDARF